MTVSGLIPADTMGITLPHEHLVVREWDYRERNYFNSAYMELEQFPALGGSTLVDLTSIGPDRDPCFIKRLADKTGINVIMATGYYKHAWLPAHVHRRTAKDLAKLLVQEIVEGIDDTAIHAGVIGEIGVSRPITRTEKKVLAASARAQLETGAAIIVHFDIGAQTTEYHHVLDILEAEGADLNRVALSHLVPRPDNFEAYAQLRDRGCYIGFDLFGQERWLLMEDLINTHPEVQVSSIKGFIDNGFLERILLSQNVCHILHMTVNGGYGYAHILRTIVPKLKGYGVTEQQIHTMMVINPARLLAFRV